MLTNAVQMMVPEYILQVKKKKNSKTKFMTELKRDIQEMRREINHKLLENGNILPIDTVIEFNEQGKWDDKKKLGRVTGIQKPFEFEELKGSLPKMIIRLEGETHELLVDPNQVRMRHLLFNYSNEI